MNKKTGNSKWLTLMLGLVLAFALAFTVSKDDVQASGTSMTITAVDVGDGSVYGDTTVLTTGGKTLVMDTSYEPHSNRAITWLKNNGRKNIDLYVSHYHDDHVYSMAKIMNDSYFKVGTLYLPNPDYIKKAYQKNKSYATRHYNDYTTMVNTAKKRGIKIVWLDKGSSFNYGNAKIEVLWGNHFDPGTHYDTHFINSNSMVTRISCGGVRYLTCGDCEADVEAQMVAAGIDLKADIYKASHHGANGSNSEAFVSKVQPSWSFWNCTDETSSSLGTVGWISSTYARLRQYGNCLGVCYNGTINFNVDGGKIRVTAQRNMTNQTFSVNGKSVTLQRSKGCPWKLTNRILEMEGASGKWEQTSEGWKFRFDDGKYAVNTVVYKSGHAYYMDANGYMVKGFYKSSNGTYKADANGILFTGWVQDSGKWYFFGTDYRMATGWVKDGGKWYYMGSDGVMQKGWLTYGGKRYFLQAGGAMATGWVQDSGKWYYFGSDGIMRTGWVQTGKTWYYMNGSGVMTTGWMKIGNAWYYFNGSGVMKTGWVKDGNAWYYLNGSGVMTTGWQKVSGKWYYMGANGVMQTGVVKYGKALYLMNTSGVMLTGKQTVNGLPYNLNSNGVMATGWQKVSNKWYYIDGNGQHLAGKQKVNGQWYFFDKSTRVMKTGWVKDGSAWLLAKSNGTLNNGWYKEGKVWYYFDNYESTAGVKKIGNRFYLFRENNTSMADNAWVTYQGNTYHAAAGGVLSTGKTEIGGKTYFFDRNDASLQKNKHVEGGVTDSQGVWEKEYESKEEITDSTNNKSFQNDSAAEGQTSSEAAKQTEEVKEKEQIVSEEAETLSEEITEEMEGTEAAESAVESAKEEE